MGKAPASQFYWWDWERDMAEHSLEIEGAWMRICCKLWSDPSHFEAEKTLEQWTKILGVSRIKTIKIINYLSQNGIADFDKEREKKDKSLPKVYQKFTKRNTKVFIKSRRMERDEVSRIINNTKRMKSYYAKKESGNVTDLSGKCNPPLHTSSSLLPKGNGFVGPGDAPLTGPDPNKTSVPLSAKAASEFMKQIVEDLKAKRDKQGG